jgi:protocatechuate 3,4-dioxygenase, alpha subunit
MSIHTATSSQTIGPFFHDGMLRDDAQCQVLVAAQTAGARIRIEGYVYDGDGLGVPDAMLEIWQANHHGRYNHPADQRAAPLDPHFSGFGRCGTDATGFYWFETIKPGPVPFDDRHLQAPHICVAVFARGLLNHLTTRLYFADEPANAEDPILRYVPSERRGTLLAQRASAGDAVVYRFDVVLQGAGETVFFNV